MAKRLFWKRLWWGLLAVLFGTLAYGGWRFIEEARRSAAGIDGHRAEPKPAPDINSFNLSQNATRQAVQNQSPLWQTPVSVSNGEDVKIIAGDFAYNGGRPQVTVSLLNQGGFQVVAVALRLALYLDDADTPAAEAVGVPVSFEMPLLGGESRDVTLDVPQDAAWTAEAVRAAGKRRILAQVVSVSDGDRDSVDYPQTGEGVLLKPTDGDEPPLNTDVIEPPPEEPELPDTMEEGQDIENGLPESR